MLASIIRLTRVKGNLPFGPVPVQITPVAIENRTEVVRLENGGATIALSEYGDPRGVPVFFCHGWPSSRSMAELTHDAASELGVRIISPDRPGIRGSKFQADRRLLDWPPLLAALADHLEIDRFRIFGISGGAPYAYASAWMMPERVEKVAVASGAPPIAELPDGSGLLNLYNHMLALRKSQPALLRTLFHIARPFASMKMPIRIRPLLLKLLQPCDANVLRDSRSFESCFESARQAWRASATGVMADAEIYAEPWGFPLEEVTVPVQLWHGKKDRTFSFRLAEEIATRLPKCELHVVEDVGHFSLPIRRIPDILADLIR